MTGTNLRLGPGNILHSIGEPCQISAPTTMREPHGVEVQDSQLLNRLEPENRKKLIEKTSERKAKRLVKQAVYRKEKECNCRTKG